MEQTEQGKQKLEACSITHILLRILAVLIFEDHEDDHGSFYHSELAVMVGCRTSRLDDLESVVLQLQLEKKLADYWLEALQPWTGSCEAGLRTDDNNRMSSTYAAAVDKYTGLFMSSLATNASLLWSDSAQLSSTPVELLTPAARRLVAAALKVEIIAAAMHSRLIKIWVPGLLRNMSQLGSQAPETPLSSCSDAVVPKSWAGWPGVVPLDSCSKELMQPGVRLLPSSAPGLFSEDDPEVAAVFCQEPAVVQLAERVGDLAESVGRRQQHSGPRSPYKVLIKARMSVAA